MTTKKIYNFIKTPNKKNNNNNNDKIFKPFKY